MNVCDLKTSHALSAFAGSVASLVCHDVLVGALLPLVCIIYIVLNCIVIFYRIHHFNIIEVYH